MKFTPFDIPKLLLKIKKKEIKSLLIYGINYGLADTIIQEIVNKNNLIISEFNIKDLDADKLLLVANNKNFFQQQELIRITGIKDTISKEIRECIIQNDFIHFICFRSDELLPAGGIRNFFEISRDVASIGCYYGNEGVIEKVILQQCKQYQKTIDTEALSYLKFYLRGDNNIIKSELDKIFKFTHDKTKITKSDVLLVISDDLQASGDEMCIAFAKGNAQRFLSEVKKLKCQNKDEILMIRVIIRYYLKIYIVAQKIESGMSMDAAIKSLSPPIFFKYIADFRQIITKYTSTDVVKYLTCFWQAEIAYKKSSKSFDMFSLLMAHQS